MFLIIFIFWFVLWFITWGAFNSTLAKKGINHQDKFFISILFFLLLTSVSLVINLLLKNPYLANLQSNLLLLPFFLILFSFLVYFLINHFFSQKILDYRYLLSKPFDILFQQFMIVLLIILLQKYTSSSLVLILSFGLIFTLIHSPILIFKKNKWGKILLAGSFFAGLIFPYLIINLHSGLIFSYTTHWLFYLTIGTVYTIWIKQKPSSNALQK